MEILSYHIEMFDIIVRTAITELVVALVAWTGIWYAIRWRERVRATRGLASHSGLRLVLAPGVMLMILFSGSCTLIFGALTLQVLISMSPSDVEGRKILSGIIEMILAFGGIPFAVATLLWFVVLVRKKS